MRALTNAIWLIPRVNRSPPENLEYRPKYLGEFPQLNLKIPETLISLLRVSRKIFKSPDSRKILRFPEDFFFSPKQILRVNMHPSLILHVCSVFLSGIENQSQLNQTVFSAFSISHLFFCRVFIGSLFCIIFSFNRTCDLCDEEYVGYTARHSNLTRCLTQKFGD